MKGQGERGYSLIETLVAISVFAVLSTSLYLVLFQVTRGATKARDIAEISQEARIGFTRMVRDTRQGSAILDSPSGTSPDGNDYTVWVDFNGDGAQADTATDLEILTYSFQESDKTVRLNGQVLMRGVDCLRRPDNTCYPAFDYGSGHLEWDWSNDGVTTWQELDTAPTHGVIGIGNNDDVLNDAEMSEVSYVSIALRLEGETDTTDFASVAQLRNQR